jgi:serine/threonine-protein kinase
VRDNDAALLWAHLTEAVPDIGRSRPDLPPTVHGAVSKAMAKSSGDRYPTCGEFISALADELYASGRGAPQGLAYGPDRADTPAAAAAPMPAARYSGSLDGHPPGRSPVGEASTAVRRRRWRTVLAALVGVAVIAVAVLGYKVLFGKPSTIQFVGSDVVPFAFAYPADWKQAGPANDVLFSPRADELVPLFLSEKGGGQDWSPMSRFIRDDPAGVSGLFTFSTFTSDASRPIDEQKQSLTLKLPPNVSFTGADSHALLGRSTATRLSGELSDPANKATVLHFECYIAQVPTAAPRTAFLIFFAPKDSFDDRRGAFDRVAASVVLRH